MDFNLTGSEKMLQRLAREFAGREVAPVAAHIDRTGEFPTDLARKMGQLDFTGLPYPEPCGGSGGGYVSYALALEQIAQASMTAAAIMAVNTVPEEAVYRFGNQEQKARLLRPLAKGEALGGIAFTEAETGSDPKALKTMSSRVEGGYKIYGEKHFVAMAAKLDFLLLFARRESTGLNAFIIDCKSPGFEIGELCETMGLRGLQTADVRLDGLFVPQENLIGGAGNGFDVLLEAISLGRLGVAVEAVGVAQAALDLATNYARERKVRGKPLARLGSTEWLLAEMASRIEAARWLTYRTAFLRDQGQSIRYESSIAKLFASQAAVEVTRMAMQVLGSYGTMTSLPVERLYRDAKMTEVYVGISELQRSLIAGYLTQD